MFGLCADCLGERCQYLPNQCGRECYDDDRTKFMSGEPVVSSAGEPKNSTHSRKARALLSQQSPSVEPPAPLTIVPPAPLTPAPLTIVPDLTRAQIVPPAPLTPAPLSIVPPGTIRWIIQDDGQGKLLVIDAYLVPGKLVLFDTSINVTQRRYPQRHDMFLRARHLIKTSEPEKTKTHDAQQKACPTHLRH